MVKYQPKIVLIGIDTAISLSATEGHIRFCFLLFFHDTDISMVLFSCNVETGQEGYNKDIVNIFYMHSHKLVSTLHLEVVGKYFQSQTKPNPLQEKEVFFQECWDVARSEHVDILKIHIFV